MARSETLYTKDQLQAIMSSWGCTESVPKKGQQVFVVWPVDVQPNTAVITMTDKKSDYGKRLYLVVMGMAEEVFPVANQPKDPK
jgi:hypothetical protein